MGLLLQTVAAAPFFSRDIAPGLSREALHRASFNLYFSAAAAALLVALLVLPRRALTAARVLLGFLRERTLGLVAQVASAQGLFRGGALEIVVLACLRRGELAVLEPLHVDTSIAIFLIAASSFPESFPGSGQPDPLPVVRGAIRAKRGRGSTDLGLD